jgi:hypothetical protein
LLTLVLPLKLLLLPLRTRMPAPSFLQVPVPEIAPL